MSQLLYFTATWCQPCKRFGPIMDDIASETGIEVNRFDADDDENVMAAFKVVSVPTVVKLDTHGNEIARIVGAKPKAVALRELNI